MILDLKKAFTSESYSETFTFTLELGDIEFSGIHPFNKPTEVVAKLEARAETVTLNICFTACYNAPCDRCATNCSENITVNKKYILATEIENEDNDGILLVTEGELDLAELCRTDVLLQIPMKHLCNENCKGLCPQCGANLNEKVCGCNKKTVDPRLAALAELLK